MSSTVELEFGVLGLRIGDEIVFAPTGTVCTVCSGAGVPGNGGTLVAIAEQSGGLYSLRAASRLLLGDSLEPTVDIWSLWTHEGCSLRRIHESRTAC